LTVCVALGGAAASAHYFYTQFPSKKAPYAPIIQKFDVAALPNGTVPYFISASGPVTYASGDSFNALVSEIRAGTR
jgi:hypothetical protein